MTEWFLQDDAGFLTRLAAHETMNRDFAAWVDPLHAEQLVAGAGLLSVPFVAVAEIGDGGQQKGGRYAEA